MESEEGKNNFLKKYGLCAVRLMARLRGWRGQPLGRRAEAEPGLIPLGHSEGSVRLCARAGSPFCHHRIVATAGRQAAAPACPLSTNASLDFRRISRSSDVPWAPSGLKAPGDRKQRCKNSPALFLHTPPVGVGLPWPIARHPG